jgi:hypothetical protein
VLVPGLLALGACSTGPRVSIDWINFVQWDGVTYVSEMVPSPAGASGPALGAEVGTVKRKLADNETDPHHKLQDGDAGFLAAGTAIYGLREYKTSFRVAVRSSSGIVIYEADTNAKASIGADLLDLAGKVDYLTIRDSNDHELAAIRDATAVSRLVSLVLKAPVDQAIQPPASSPELFVAIHFLDGTWSVRAFWPSTGELQRGILAGPEFAHAILSAIPSPAA